MRFFHLFFAFNLKKILAIAILLRVFWAFFVPVDPVADSYLYNEFAKSIASGNGYAYPNGDITVYWPVGTSAIYAGLYKLFGVSFLPIVMFNLIVGACIVWLTYNICKRHLNKTTAQIAAILLACWPILIQFTTILASELIFICLVLGAFYVWGSTKISPILRAIIWGALVCGATYVRPTALPLIAILPALQWLTKGNYRACIVSFIVASITAALLFAPWVYRNQQQFGAPILVSANGGVNLWMGNNPSSNGGYQELPDVQFKNEVVRDNYYKKEAIQFIKNNPQQYIKLAIQRFVMTYKAETIGVVWNGFLEKNISSSTLLGLKLACTLYWWLMLALAGVGLYQLLKIKTFHLFHPLIMVAAFFFIFPILTVGQDRYHLPVNPFLAILAACAIHQFLNKSTVDLK